MELPRYSQFRNLISQSSAFSFFPIVVMGATLLTVSGCAPLQERERSTAHEQMLGDQDKKVIRILKQIAMSKTTESLVPKQESFTLVAAPDKSAPTTVLADIVKIKQCHPQF